MEFSRLEYWSGLPFPSPGDLPDPGIKLRSPALQADSLPPEPPGRPYRAGKTKHHQKINYLNHKRKLFIKHHPSSPFEDSVIAR